MARVMFMDMLLSGGLVLLPDFSARVTDVCIRDGKILSVGPVPDDFRPEKVMDCTGRAVIPGLVNAHTHAYMTVFRNWADDLPFADWLFGRIMPLEDQLTAEDCYWSSLLGIMEMLATGTTAFLDMYIHPDSVSRASAESGIRAVLSRGLSGGESDPAGGARRIREALADWRAWRDSPRLTFMLGPHALYTCDEEYLCGIAGLSRETGLGIHVHLAESQSEMEDAFSRYGCSPTALMDRCGILGPRTVAAHGIRLSGEEIALLADRGVSVATNPLSNLKLANGVAPVPALLSAGVNVALGTDGPASNNALNLFRDLAALAAIHKGVGADPTLVTARQALYCAARGGAAALGLNTGEIAPGREADLAVLDLDKPWLTPLGDLAAALCYAATGAETESVLVGGQLLYHRGEYLTIDADRVRRELAATRKRLGME